MSMGDQRGKDGSMISEGTLVKWTGDGAGLIKDDGTSLLVYFSATQFLKCAEGRRENLGRRCRYLLKTGGGKHRLEACKIRLLPAGGTGPEKKNRILISRENAQKNIGRDGSAWLLFHPSISETICI